MKKEVMNILLVEDNPDHAELIVKELKNNGGVINTIYAVKDGQEALDFLYHQGGYSDLLKAPRPGLILLDLNLPKISGEDVLKKIKADDNLKTIPVVVLTTSSQERDIARSYANGVNSLITKPIKFEEFVKVVKEIKLYWLLTNTGEA
ncbi:MAG: response regulator [Candidatus Omnitrophica bacterium]|nr:response regulator [Candidatus Omnitrophota bacterium]MBU1851657.1 response regulator [Candidatus Omnitrophota bacterium]